MNQVDELMALADKYADAGIYEPASKLRDKLRAALEAALKPHGKPAAVFDELLGRPVLVQGAPLLTHGQVLYTAAPPAQTPVYINQAESHGYLSQPVTIRNSAQTPPPRLSWSAMAEVIKKSRGYVTDDEVVIARAIESAVRAQFGVNDE